MSNPESFGEEYTNYSTNPNFYIQSFKPKKKKGYLKNSMLVILAFASAFCSRLLDSLGAPSVINFAHFLMVPYACAVTLAKTRVKDPHQIYIIRLLIISLLIFFGVVCASTLWNNAGIINGILSFLLLGEPFIVILTIVSLSLSRERFQRFRLSITSFLIFHVFLAQVQKYILKVENWHHVGMEPEDRIQGIFFVSGAGHVVGASVSLTFGLYYLLCAKEAPLWLRVVVMAAAFWQIMIADAKQVLMAFMAAAILLLLTKFKSVGEALKYIIGGTLLGYGFWWCIQNVEAFAAYTVWATPELYGPEGDATILKTTAFRVIPTHYTSWVNWWVGLGPGHTVGRLGGWMLHQYSSLFGPLGATIHQASFDVWAITGSFYIASRSSLFSPLFGWAGIWGDLGFLGLGAYLLLSAVVWYYICFDDFSKFLMLTVLVFGLIFTQMEEPGYMISVATIIALRWLDHRNKLKTETSSYTIPHL